jgi:hypothetical protein
MQGRPFFFPTPDLHGPNERRTKVALAMMKLYRALRSANVPDTDAIEAAEEVAQFENRLSKIEADLLVLKWMVGTAVVLMLGGFTANIGILIQLLGRIPPLPH